MAHGTINIAVPFVIKWILDKKKEVVRPFFCYNNKSIIPSVSESSC
jgi:hypothetical protein